jgi:hypothetical protein
LKEGRESGQDHPSSGQAKKAKARCKFGKSVKFGALRSKIRYENNSIRTEYELENFSTDVA